jgi:hypothetical protein
MTKQYRSEAYAIYATVMSAAIDPWAPMPRGEVARCSGT